MQYRILSPDAYAELRIERMRELEIEHARHALRLEDASDHGERVEIQRMLHDLERRHGVHTAWGEGESDDGDESGEGPRDETSPESAAADSPDPEPTAEPIDEQASTQP